MDAVEDSSILPVMLNPAQQLTTNNHRRDLAGLNYVYPVVSRRSGGVSVGINLNPNNACNWRCVYCQVENLSRGAAPLLDLSVLAEELDTMLHSIVHGDFMQQHVPENLRRLNDIALSGNGEPTTSPHFAEVIDLIDSALRRFDLLQTIKLILITNGSQMLKPEIQAALSRMAQLNGEVWFKLDRADAAEILQVNQVVLDPQRVNRQLQASTGSCPTWIQSCFFAWDGREPPESSVNAYLRFLSGLHQNDVDIRGVLLYGVERPSMQQEASRIGKLPQEWLETLAGRIRALGYVVNVSA